MKTDLIWNGDIVARGNRLYRVDYENDDAARSSWEDDGHGPVSEWVHRDKKPGEVILCRGGRMRRYYDFAEATRIAKRDRWGIADETRDALVAKLGRAPTAGEVIRAAVTFDYQYLRGWCDGSWGYVGVVVTDVTNTPDVQDTPCDYHEAVWGVEADQERYLTQVAQEIIAGKYALYVAEQTEAAHWAERDVVTV